MEKYGKHQAELSTAQKTPLGLDWVPALPWLKGLLSTLRANSPSLLFQNSQGMALPLLCMQLPRKYLLQDSAAVRSQVYWCKKGWGSSHFTHFGCKQAVTEKS